MPAQVKELHLVICHPQWFLKRLPIHNVAETVSGSVIFSIGIEHIYRLSEERTETTSIQRGRRIRRKILELFREQAAQGTPLILIATAPDLSEQKTYDFSIKTTCYNADFLEL